MDRIVCLDLETTGLDKQRDEIVEICIEDNQGKEMYYLLKPNVPISPEAFEVHNIHEDDLIDKPEFGDVADKIQEFLDGSILMGHNIWDFDLPILQRQLNETLSESIDLFSSPCIDTLILHRKLYPSTLEAVFKRFTGQELDEAHSSQGDVKAVFAIFDKMCELNKDLPNEPLEIAEWCFPEDPDAITRCGKIRFNQDGIAILNFGKHKGSSLEIAAKDHSDYLNWMLGQDFPDDLKEVVRNALEGDFPIK